MPNIVQVRSERLKRWQDPENHKGHPIKMIDLNNDKQFDIQWCDCCKMVLMDTSLP